MSSLGASNGLLQFFICLSRSFSPLLSRCVRIDRVQVPTSLLIGYSSIFVVSVENDLFMGYGWAILLSVISMGSIHFSGCIMEESKRLRS